MRRESDHGRNTGFSGRSYDEDWTLKVATHSGASHVYNLRRSEQVVSEDDNERAFLEPIQNAVDCKKGDSCHIQIRKTSLVWRETL